MICAYHFDQSEKSEIVKLSRRVLSKKESQPVMFKRRKAAKLKSGSVQPCKKGICKMSWIVFSNILNRAC